MNYTLILIIVVVLLLIDIIIRLSLNTCGRKTGEERVRKNDNTFYIEEKLAEIQRDARKSSSILEAVSDIYYILYEINLDEDSLTGIRASDTIRKYVSEYAGASECLSAVAANMFSDDTRSEAVEFLDVKTWQERLKTEKCVSAELHGVETGWCRISLIVSERSSDGRVIRVVVTAQDINEDKKKIMEYQSALQDALIAAQHANKAKTTFLNNMSHDIRTPMNAIIGFTSLAMTHIDKPEQVKDYLSKIITSCNHLLSLINDVLDMSRIESGHVRIEENECSLASIMHDLRNLLQADIRAKNLDLYIDTLDVTDENVYCDRLRLSQVLLNIVSNSVKYTRPGGSVAVRLAEKGVSDGYADYSFIIKDNGIGMKQEFLEHIYEPFTREETSTVSGIQGTGLGLAITKNIVDLMNGEIIVTSEEGVGTETTLNFRFRLGSGHGSMDIIGEIEGMHALVVDDDMNTCESVSKMLKSIGVRPDWTISGKEAIFRSRMATEDADPFNIYIIDWLLPDINGIEVVRRIRREISADIPIIVMTAYDWTDIEEEAREAGVTAFCSKPLFVSELYSILKRQVEEELSDEPENLRESHDFSGKRVLLVEDNEINREIAMEILTESGIAVETAENGRIGVDMFKSSDSGYYSLVLMDVQMPVMNGYEATRSIRRSHHGDALTIPIVALTANAFTEDSQQAFQAGMTEYLTKPFDKRKLYAVLEKYMK